MANDFKARIARTLCQLFGEPILYDFYKNDPKTNKSEVAVSEKMIDEIQFNMKSSIHKHLKDGDMFGEQAFLRESTRTASVRCTEDTHLTYLTRDEFFRVYNQIVKNRTDKRIQFIKQISLFAPLGKNWL